MEWFGPIRTLFLKNLAMLPWAVPILTALAVIALLIWRGKAALRPAGLTLALGVAMWGQVFVGQKRWLEGGALYGAAALLFLIWLLALRGDRDWSTALPAAWSRRTELALILALALTAAFARFYRFDKVPYGIEGDEAKWSVQTAAEMLAGERRWDSDYRLKHVPYTYWVEAFFYRVLGVGIDTARWQVAFLSVLASVLFYLVGRRILGPPAAFVAAFALAVCAVDVSASRFAHVESQIKLPLILSFLGLVYAVDTQRPGWYLFTGLALAAGLLTFDTFFLAPAVVGLWLGGRLLFDRRVRWLPSRGDWAGKLWRAVLFLAPVALVAQRAWFYISTRRADHNKSAASLTRAGMDAWEKLWPQLQDNLAQVMTNFADQRWGDFIYNRQGPIFNAALIPFAALGLIYLIVRWRRGLNGVAPLWFLLLFFPAAVAFGSPYIRVFYPAYPAFYLLAAAAVMLLVRSLLPLGGQNWRAGVTMVVLAALALVGVVNLSGFLHESRDFLERIKRREMTDLVTANLAAGQMLYVPYMPRYDDFVEWDREYLQFLAWGGAPVGKEGTIYRLLAYDQLLPVLSREAEELAGATVLYDRDVQPLAAERQAIIDAVVRCFPEVRIQRTQRFEALKIPASGLAAPRCSAAVSVFAQTPHGVTPAGQPLTFAWRTEPRAAASTVRVEIGKQAAGVAWLEAEDLFNAPGWYVEGRFAPNFGGRGYLGDWYRAADVTAQVALPAAGRYTVWARTHRRVTAEMPFTILVAGRAFPAAQHRPEQFDQWLWERLGEVDAPAGRMPVTLHRDFTDGRHMSVFLDALVFSADPGFNPAAGLWPVIFHSPEAPAKSGQFVVTPSAGTQQAVEMGLSPTAARWPVQLIAGQRLVDAVLLVDDPTLDLATQEVWRLLSQPPAPPVAVLDLRPGTYRWRVQALDAGRIVGPAGADGQWSDWVTFTVR
jgi:4-amino-4-deoxy-L-arabinose transferase-like glycosyltransferase